MMSEFCAKYEIQKFDIKSKYNTRALLYNRRRLEANAYGMELNETEPTFEEGR